MQNTCHTWMKFQLPSHFFCSIDQPSIFHHQEIKEMVDLLGDLNYRDSFIFNGLKNSVQYVARIGKCLGFCGFKAFASGIVPSFIPLSHILVELTHPLWTLWFLINNVHNLPNGPF